MEDRKIASIEFASMFNADGSLTSAGEALLEVADVVALNGQVVYADLAELGLVENEQGREVDSVRVVLDVRSDAAGDPWERELVRLCGAAWGSPLVQGAASAV